MSATAVALEVLDRKDVPHDNNISAARMTEQSETRPSANVEQAAEEDSQEPALDQVGVWLLAVQHFSR
jgi:hypothetical protein